MSLPILVVLLLAGAPAAKKVRKTPPPVAAPSAPEAAVVAPPAPVEKAPAAAPAPASAPVATASQSATRVTPPEHRLGVAALGGPGFSLVGGPITWRVAARVEFLAAQINSRVGIFVVGPVAFGYWTLTTGLAGVNFTTSATVLEFTPTLRVQFQLLPILSIYGDGGVGLVFASTVTAARFVGYSEFSNFGLQFRTGLGARLELSKRFSLFLEPLGLDYILMGTSTTIANGVAVVRGGGGGSRYSILLGATFLL